jgi:gliding motility-associated-like protein
MKSVAWIILFFTTGIRLYATHVVGGEISYEYLGGTQYRITLKVYRDCGPTNVNGTGFDENASVGIYLSGNGALYDGNFSLSLSSAVVSEVPIALENPCFILPDGLCVERAVYSGTINLPANAQGYDITYQRCCRNPSIVNLDTPEDQGATFTTHVPGTSEASGNNSSAVFENFPPVALCLNAEFYFDHSAVDGDGDSLVYTFCAPMQGGSTTQPAPQPPTGPPYNTVNWDTGFNSGYPITSNPAMAIDEATGFITGTATALGQYVIGVCVSEYRDGVLINTSNRDFQFNVTLCDPNIVASVPDQTDFCDGLTVQFGNTSINGSSFYWDFGVPDIDSDTSNLATPSFTYPDQGVYTVMLIANPTWPCADTTFTTHTALPVISPIILVGGYECLNGEDTYDFGVTANVSANASYAWDFGSGSTPATSALSAPQDVILDPSLSVQNISLVITDNGCTESDDEQVDNPLNPIASISPQTEFCSGLIVDFSSLSSNGQDFLWDFGASGLSDFSQEESPTWEYLAPGDYTVTLTVTTPNTCPSVATASFEVYPQISPSYDAPNPICFGEDSFDFMADGANTSNAQYQWDFGASATPTTSALPNPQNVSYSQSGTYAVNLTILENGCSATYTDSVQVVDHFITNFEINNAAGCPGLLVQLQGEATSQVPVYYAWDFGDGTTSNQNNTTHVYESPGLYDVQVTAYTISGCQDSSTMVFPGAVRVYPYPDAGFFIQPQVVPFYAADTYISSQGCENCSCNYLFSDGGTSDVCDLMYSWTESGIQTITQYVTSEYGCTSTATGTVIIEGLSFYAPNAFTPDGDGINDEWQPITAGVTRYELKIFNRWGEMMYTSTNPKIPWLGQHGDGDYYCPNGVYEFRIHLQDLEGLEHDYQGWISLIR